MLVDPRSVARCALVFDLPSPLHELVIAFRERFDGEAFPAQFPPHFTLLYLGEYGARELPTLASLFAPLASAEIDVEAVAVNTFGTPGKGNVHLRVTESPELRRLHALAVETLTTGGYALQTQHAGEHWVPHVTILDGVHLPETLPALMTPVAAHLRGPKLLVTPMPSEAPSDEARIQLDEEGCSRAARALARQPVLARALADAVDTLRVSPNVQIEILGSVARDEIDRWSDLDMRVAVADGAELDDAQANVARRVGSLGRLLAQFRADHVGKPDIIVTFLEREGEVVKIDVEVAPARRLPRAEIVLAAIEQPPSRPGPPAGPGSNVADRFHRLIGWSWYTFTKVHRGEAFEADDSLRVMRQDALLPLIQLRNGAPQEGYRWLERRLPGPVLDRLAGCIPASLDPSEQSRALEATLDLAMETADAIEPSFTPRLERMRTLMAKAR